jgi:hypothetical protein
MDAASEFYERMRRAVGRAVQHLDGLGLDTEALNGVVMLTIKDGQLTHIQLPMGYAYPEGPDNPFLTPETIEIIKLDAQKDGPITYGMSENGPVGGYEPVEGAQAATDESDEPGFIVTEPRNAEMVRKIIKSTSKKTKE